MNPAQGLTSAQVLENRKKFGSNILVKKKLNPLTLIFRQIFGNPLILILVIATTVSFFLNEKTSSIYIFLMILSSVFLGFWNEYSAEKTVENLLKKVSYRALVIREGNKVEIPVGEIVVGDVIFIGPGDIVPADASLTDTSNLEINESVLTGESVAVYKKTGPVFMGTIVIGGWAYATVTSVGKDTQFGKIAQDVSFVKPETDFQKGLANFGQLLVRVIIILTICMFVVNALLGREVLTSLLFSLAVAVGLTPELLPVIITISLSHGAGKLSKKHVVAKQLVSIENLGNMDVLCTDKTGTLTEGSIQLVGFDSKDKESTKVLEFGLISNSAILAHKAKGNPIDIALWHYAQKNSFKISYPYTKLREQPFDYEKKATFTVAKLGTDKHPTMIVKGAPEDIFEMLAPHEGVKYLRKAFVDLSGQGYRVLAVAHKEIPEKSDYSWKDTSDLKFEGFLKFMDTPKKSAKEALVKLKRLSVSVKILTGDNEIITKRVAEEVGIEDKEIMRGDQLDKLSEVELENVIDVIDIFARVSPEQKLRIIRTLKKKGHTVGYMGDGVNDIPSLHSADVGISVDTGVDVAKDAANIILLRKGLDVIADGIIEGRRTFSNTLKYILMGTSSNFGNMFSAAASSFILPFLPMTPAQILLTNGMYDVSQMTLPTDNVDHESLTKPKHWDMSFIRDYMLFFGPISSIYDFITFGVMYYFFHARGALFQTGWFIESLATQVLVIFIIRTSKKPFFKSHPSKYVTIASLSVVALAILLPFTPLAASLGLVAPPPLYFLFLVGAVSTYLAIVEFSKRIFLSKYRF